MVKSFSPVDYDNAFIAVADTCAIQGIGNADCGQSLALVNYVDDTCCLILVKGYSLHPEEWYHLHLRTIFTNISLVGNDEVSTG